MTERPEHLEGLRVVGPAIPEVGGGWVVKHLITDKKLAHLETDYRLIPSGKHTIIQDRKTNGADIALGRNR